MSSTLILKEVNIQFLQNIPLKIIPNDLGILPKRIREQFNTYADVNDRDREGSNFFCQNT